jgi:molecular chaperone Hsp33
MAQSRPTPNVPGGAPTQLSEAEQKDHVVPFQVEGMEVRGRIVRLGPVVTDILTRHDYPTAAARLLGEGLTLTAMLGISLKHEGELILQAQGDGPVRLLVCSFTAPDKIRGYAQVDRERLSESFADRAPTDLTLRDLMGTGHFALTIDQGPYTNRYQGIVTLDRDTLSDCAQDYFMQSEQIATRIRVAVGESFDGGGARAWQSGGLMIQHLAAEGGLTDADERAARLEARETVARTSAGEDIEEAWNRAAVLLDTVEDHELLDFALPPDRLLYSLYHEDGVRVFDTRPILFDCRCSRDRLRDVLAKYPRDQMDDMLEEDGKIRARCEFCNETYEFDPDNLV